MENDAADTGFNLFTGMRSGLRTCQLDTGPVECLELDLQYVQADGRPGTLSICVRQEQVLGVIQTLQNNGRK